jgi:hypothetical protein
METPFPIKPPSINQSPKEIADIQVQMEAGLLPKDYLKKHIDAVDENVFGTDAPKDRDGFRLEQGQGSSKNQTQQSIDAYIKNQTERRAGGPEPGYEEHLKRMRAELAACEKAKDGKADVFHYGRK